MKIKGNAIKYGNDINTDLIIPGRYLSYENHKELANHAMEDLDPYFLNKFHKGDIIVAGKNFGCGSSREQAVICLKNVGVGAIIAKSFSRIFFRNAINIGLPIIECAKLPDIIQNQDEIQIDYENGKIENLSKKKKYSIEPFPDIIREIIKNGGLVQYIKKNLLK